MSCLEVVAAARRERALPSPDSIEADRSIRVPPSDEDVSFATASDGKYVATSSSPTP